MDDQNSNTAKNQNNPVGWFEIYTNDLHRAQKFYETVFNVDLQELGDPTNTEIKMLAFPMNMEGPNASGALVKVEGMPAGGNSTIVYFTSADCSIEEARVVSAGGKIHTPKMSIGDYGFVSLCTDTEGNMIGIHSMN